MIFRNFPSSPSIPPYSLNVCPFFRSCMLSFFCASFFHELLDYQSLMSFFFTERSFSTPVLPFLSSFTSSPRVPSPLLPFIFHFISRTLVPLSCASSSANVFHLYCSLFPFISISHSTVLLQFSDMLFFLSSSVYLLFSFYSVTISSFPYYCRHYLDFPSSLFHRSCSPSFSFHRLFFTSKLCNQSSV